MGVDAAQVLRLTDRVVQRIVVRAMTNDFNRLGLGQVLDGAVAANKSITQEAFVFLSMSRPTKS